MVDGVLGRHTACQIIGVRDAEPFRGMYDVILTDRGWGTSYAIAPAKDLFLDPTTPKES